MKRLLLDRKMYVEFGLAAVLFAANILLTLFLPYLTEHKRYYDSGAYITVLAIAFAVSSLSAVLVSSLVGSYRRGRVSAAAATTRVLPEVNSANSVSNENYASKGKETPIFNCTSSGVSDYDWTYSGSSDNAAINCSYDPDSNVYRFTAEGVHAAWQFAS